MKVVQTLPWHLTRIPYMLSRPPTTGAVVVHDLALGAWTSCVGSRGANVLRPLAHAPASGIKPQIGDTAYSITYITYATVRTHAHYPRLAIVWQKMN